MRSKALVVLVVLLVAGAAAVRAADGDPRCANGTEIRMGSRTQSYVGAVIHNARVYNRPGGTVKQLFDNIEREGGPQVFAILSRVVDGGCNTRWYDVQLPVRPNGAHGYVRVFAVHVFSVRTKIVVELGKRRLTLLRRGRVLLRTPVAVGASATPTPRGHFFVKESIRLTNPHGVFGPGALGLSSYSPVLTGWVEGGPIGIHGTDDPSSIGHPRSNGCIRVPNAVALRLLHLVPLGTPVVVR